MSYPTALTTQVSNPRLRLLNGLKAGSKPVMTFMGLSSARTAQVVALSGVDSIILDCEHGNISDDQMHNGVLAIASLGVSPIIRIRAPLPDLIKRALDTGAHGIMVPQINTAEEAETVVNYSKFPPQGLRGQGSFFPAIAHGITTPEYMKTADQTLVTCIQIETRAGLENVDAICAVPGVDLIFIGPNDLAQSVLGYVPARGDEPEFVAALDKIVAAAKKHGKWVARLSNSGELAKQHLEIYDTVALGADMKAITMWYQQELAVVRS
ncbi:hypothetical protein Q5752_003953 [Cryptotrichosporon argae]